MEAAVCYGCLTGLHGVQVWAWGVLFASLRDEYPAPRRQNFRPLCKSTNKLGQKP
jgi:hypothetical protein